MPLNVGELQAKLTLDRSAFKQGLASAHSEGSKGGHDIGGKVVGGISKALIAGAAVVGAAAAAGLAKALQVGIDFDKQMSAVKAKTGAVGSEFAQLRKQAIDLGMATTFSSSEVAQGMEIVGAAGLKTREVLAAMPGLLDATAASGSDMATTTEIVVAAMSSYNLKAQDSVRIGDVLAKAANESMASMTDLGYSLKYVGPVAKIAGMSLEETAAALALMAKAGIKGDQAGTTLRMGLARLASQPKRAAKAMKELGIGINDAHGKMKPFPKLLGELQAEFRGLSQAQKIQSATAIFGTEAASGMLALIDASPDKYRKMLAAMNAADGSAKETAATMKDNLAGSLEQLGGSAEALGIKITDAFGPTIRPIVDGFTAMLNGVDLGAIGAKFGPELADLKTALTQLSATAGPMIAQFAKDFGPVLVENVRQGIIFATNLTRTINAWAPAIDAAVRGMAAGSALMNALVFQPTSAGLALLRGDFRSAASTMMSSFDNAVKAVGAMFGKKWSISGVIATIDHMIAVVKSGIDRVRSMFSNMRITLPRFPLPHFSVSGTFNPLKMQVPSVGVNWYAKGGYFDKPSIIGVGEAGPEWVVNQKQMAALTSGGGRGGGDTYHITINADSMADENRIAGALEVLLSGIARDSRSLAYGGAR